MTRFSELPAVSSLSGTDILPVVQGGVTKRATISQLPTGSGGTTSVVLLSATNDGSTDVTAAINAAATSAVSLGLPLYIPKGNYLCSSGVSFPAGLKVSGMGPSSRLFGSRNGSYIVQTNSNTFISDLTIENNYGGGCIGIDIAGSSVNVNINRVKFYGQNSQAVNANSTGISNLNVDHCIFDTVTYGVLTNAGANDITDVSVTYCNFINIYGDGVEFNHPAAGEPACFGFLVQGCTFSVPVGAGSGSTGGFGVGAAGVGDIRVLGNTFLPGRREAIHIEDTARRVVIDDNTIMGISGPDAYGAISLYPDCKYVSVTNNRITSITGTGIYMIYDTATVKDSDVIITGNTIDTCSAVGIQVSAEYADGDRFIIANNVVRNCGTHGIFVVGAHKQSMVYGNIVDTCGGWGVYGGDPGGNPPRLRVFRQNIITNCTNGDYYGTSSSHGTLIHDRYQMLNPTTASTGTAQSIPLFRLGAYASGRISIQSHVSGNGGIRADAIFNVTWNGTTLVCTRGYVAANGVIDFYNLQMINGVCNVMVTLSGAGVQLELAAQFSGMCMETMQTYSGTVTGTTS